MRLTSEFLVVNIDRALVSAIVVSDWRGRISQFCSQRWKGQQIIFDISGFTIDDKNKKNKSYGKARLEKDTHGEGVLSCDRIYNKLLQVLDFTVISLIVGKGEKIYPERSKGTSVPSIKGCLINHLANYLWSDDRCPSAIYTNSKCVIVLFSLIFSDIALTDSPQTRKHLKLPPWKG